MATDVEIEHVLTRERAITDQPSIVLEAVAQRDLAIENGESVVEFDENGMEVTGDGSE